MRMSARVLMRVSLGLACALAWSEPAFAQTPVPPALPFAAKAQGLLRSMSPNARVGQLFIISYLGSDGAVLGDLNELLVNYRVGGVQLHAANSNFANGPDVTRQVAELRRVAEAFEVEKDDRGVRVGLPVLQQVIARDVGLVANRDEA